MYYPVAGNGPEINSAHSACVDYFNEYDNYFVLRGALFASKNFTYKVTSTGRSYPAVIAEEISHSVKVGVHGIPINISELERYGIRKK